MGFLRKGKRRRDDTRHRAVPLALQIRAAGLPTPVAEYRFHPTRRWRFDWAFIDQRVALEVDGGVYAQGRHTRGAGYERDCEKLNEALCLGWRVLRVTPRHLANGQAIVWLQRALAISEDEDV